VQKLAPYPAATIRREHSSDYRRLAQPSSTEGQQRNERQLGPSCVVDPLSQFIRVRLSDADRAVAFKINSSKLARLYRPRSSANLTDGVRPLFSPIFLWWAPRVRYAEPAKSRGQRKVERDGFNGRSVRRPQSAVKGVRFQCIQRTLETITSAAVSKTRRLDDKIRRTIRQVCAWLARGIGQRSTASKPV